MDTTRRKTGQVISFYSYKGGTGRTLAVANVAHRLAARVAATGGRVLMIDWDVTQPSLQWLFQGRLTPALPVMHNPTPNDVGAEPGLIDLMYELDGRTKGFRRYHNEQTEEQATAMMAAVKPERYVVNTDVPGLSLMMAGRMGSDYSERVNRFGWSDLFERSPSAYMALAQRLGETFDFVLIDCPCGIGDAAGIAAVHMPEALVFLFMPNRQNIEDGLSFVQGFLSHRRNSSDLRPLLVHPVPSRIAADVPDKRLLARVGSDKESGYQPLLEGAFKSSYALPECNLGAYLDEVELVETSLMALDDEPIVSAQSEPPCQLMAPAYDAIARRVAGAVLPWESK